MRNAFVAVVLASILAGCAGSFTSQLTPGYEPPHGNEIAVTFLEYADANISTEATTVLENELRGCALIGFIPADSTSRILEHNKSELPRRITETYLRSIKDIVPAKYLLTGGISQWKKGSVGFPVASSTEVSASFTLYDLTTGKVAWSASGNETGAGGIFAESPATKAKTVFRKMLDEWSGFCSAKRK